MARRTKTGPFHRVTAADLLDGSTDRTLPPDASQIRYFHGT